MTSRLRSKPRHSYDGVNKPYGFRAAGLVCIRISLRLPQCLESRRVCSLFAFMRRIRRADLKAALGLKPLHAHPNLTDLFLVKLDARGFQVADEARPELRKPIEFRTRTSHRRGAAFADGLKPYGNFPTLIQHIAHQPLVGRNEVGRSGGAGK